MRALTPEERVHVLARVCRAALRVLALNPKRAAVLALRDPVPTSTERAFERLRSR